MLIQAGLPFTPGAAVVIEDDLEIRNLVCEILRQAGFDPHPAATGRDGVDVVRSTNPTVVTLDIGLPDIDGYEVLRRIRTTSSCYIMMLTARTDELDILTALQAGADGYLTKPFRPRELRARIDAMLRRPRTGTTHAAPTTDHPAPPHVFSSPAPAPSSTMRKSGALHRGELVLNRETRMVWVVDREVTLTRSEFDLLHELLRCNGAVRTKSTLVGVLRGDDYRGYSYVSDADRRTVEAHMGNLRRKLSHHLGTTELVTTVRGVGYRIAPLPAQKPRVRA